MAALKVLIPYNFTVYDEKALEVVFTLWTGKPDWHVTLFHAYTPLPELDLQASPEIGKTRDGMIYLSQELLEKERGLEDVKRAFVQRGFAETGVECVFKRKLRSMADEIVDLVREGGYRMLVLSHHSGRVTRLFARSVHSRVVMSLSNVTVVIAT